MAISIFSRIYYLKHLLPLDVTVFINDDGFSPNKVTIPLGGNVTWINNSVRPHWPASNPHPTHTLYGGTGCISSSLDACKGLAQGEKFSFKFDKVGVWGVHDHLSPGLVMVVEVVKNIANVDQKATIPEGVTPSADFRKLSYTKQLEGIRVIAKKDPKQTWEYLKEAFIVNGQVVGNAHEFSHIIGNESYKRSGLVGIKICDDSFAYGCFHGVTEAMLLKEGPVKIKDIEAGCLSAFPPAVSQYYTGCIHGAGHGIYTWESGSVNKALNDCDIFSEQYRNYCYDGVFMENSGEGENKVFDMSNPWKLCSPLDERYQHSCARYQSQIFLGTPPKQNSVAFVGSLCEKGPNVLMKETCLQSLGFFVAQTSLGKADEIWGKCNTMPNSNAIAICTTGAAVETVFQEYNGFKESSNSLCNKLSGTYKSSCLSSISNIIK